MDESSLYGNPDLALTSAPTASLLGGFLAVATSAAAAGLASIRRVIGSEPGRLLSDGSTPPGGS